MPIYEPLDSTTLRGSGRGRWRRHVAAGLGASAVMAAGVFGSGAANAAQHQAKPAHPQTAAGSTQQAKPHDRK